VAENSVLRLERPVGQRCVLYHKDRPFGNKHE